MRCAAAFLRRSASFCVVLRRSLLFCVVSASFCVVLRRSASWRASCVRALRRALRRCVVRCVVRCVAALCAASCAASCVVRYVVRRALRRAPCVVYCACAWLRIISDLVSSDRIAVLVDGSKSRTSVPNIS